MNKYYYGIEMNSGLSYIVESDIPDFNKWFSNIIKLEWFQFDHISEWKQSGDIIVMTSMIVRVRDISGVCCVKKG